MSKERSLQIEFVRSELMGPARSISNTNDKVILSSDYEFSLPDNAPPGIPVFWQEAGFGDWQEIIHYQEETPSQKYGTGLLYPENLKQSDITSNQNSTASEDSTDIEVETFEVKEDQGEGVDAIQPLTDSEGVITDIEFEGDEFDVSNPDMYKPSSMGISFCVNEMTGSFTFALPSKTKFFWQGNTAEPFLVNGCYIPANKKLMDKNGTSRLVSAWARRSVTDDSSVVDISLEDLAKRKRIRFGIPTRPQSLVKLVGEVFARRYGSKWIVTAVLRNAVPSRKGMSLKDIAQRTLYQSYFEIRFKNSKPAEYPKSVLPFSELDQEEQSLSLLYSDTVNWAVGHSCSAAWDTEAGECPEKLYADLMPAVELPSMTPDIVDSSGNPIKISMKTLSVPDEGALTTLDRLVDLYEKWISEERERIKTLSSEYFDIAGKHLDKCESCARRMREGIEILRTNALALKAFAYANKAMLLQQIATKKILHRKLHWNGEFVAPESAANPDKAYPNQYLEDDFEHIGNWRAFQIAFFLMSIGGLVNPESEDRDIVDLIWFPTGGGKTEAYLGVAAFYLFLQRLEMEQPWFNGLPQDGTGVFMRYTLRMLTTQQFQRASSLIAAMEFIRITSADPMGSKRFSLGLWIGGDGAPNDSNTAHQKVGNYFTMNGEHGNPLVITECPWCRSEIGFLPRPSGQRNTVWRQIGHAGFKVDDNGRRVVLACSDTMCIFGGEYDALPIEVIDERIYNEPPSLFIGTADKFSMLSYRPKAGSLFGRSNNDEGIVQQVRKPPGLILQDELHLISGPLGTLYGLYETAIEDLCTYKTSNEKKHKPKLIASTATIRGADEQVRNIFGRTSVQLFPNPGLTMSDSFFGRYARKKDGALAHGRMYLGIYANNYSSFLTTQVRLFNAALFRTSSFSEETKDAWWTLLAFYNSLRELGGARTLFDSDIRSRLSNYAYRYGMDKNLKRYGNSIEELTSRKTQAELVSVMNHLSRKWTKEHGAIDACLASNIIEVGVDIERLALMSVVGQPKSTAQYIQVTGRVGRQWWDRPGLIFAMYNPSKSRDQSHFELFHSYHRRLYEQVEPTSATPFSLEAIDRGIMGVFLLWIRQHYRTRSPNGEYGNYQHYIEQIRDLLIERAKIILDKEIQLKRTIRSIERAAGTLEKKWLKNPLEWERFPHQPDGEYLILWPGQPATPTQRRKGVMAPTSMRSVDGSVYMQISEYFSDTAED